MLTYAKGKWRQKVQIKIMHLRAACAGLFAPRRQVPAAVTRINYTTGAGAGTRHRWLDDFCNFIVFAFWSLLFIICYFNCFFLLSPFNVPF